MAFLGECVHILFNIAWWGCFLQLVCHLVYCEHFLFSVSVVCPALRCYFSYMGIHSTCACMQAPDFTETMLVIGWTPRVRIFSSYCACNCFATSQYFCSLLLQTNAALIPQKLLELHQLEDNIFKLTFFAVRVLYCNPCICLAPFSRGTGLNGENMLRC